ncbi:MAG TPA: hypothetical protein VF744_04260 [Beijerinckiaceae bacterium]|jgi:hypothetical protein
MHRRSILSVFLPVLLASPAAQAGTSQGYGNGGWFERYDPVIAQHNASGELFRIQGHCQSACTLFLGIRNVCVERSARLLFHAGHDRQRNISPKSTNRMLNAYNPSLRQYLVAGGHMNTLAFHTLTGADLIQRFGYRECPR